MIEPRTFANLALTARRSNHSASLIHSYLLPPPVWLSFSLPSVITCDCDCLSLGLSVCLQSDFLCGCLSNCGLLICGLPLCVAVCLSLLRVNICLSRLSVCLLPICLSSACQSVCWLSVFVQLAAFYPVSRVSFCVVVCLTVSVNLPWTCLCGCLFFAAPSSA
jgi:hypothetical protein